MLLWKYLKINDFFIRIENVIKLKLIYFKNLVVNIESWDITITQFDKSIQKPLQNYEMFLVLKQLSFSNLRKVREKEGVV